MKNNVLVSIIMSEYNTENDKLLNSIKSILNQSYKNFEFIIVDDSGKNKLKKIINQFDDKRIKILVNKKNMGLVYSLNRALHEAKGDYIVRMDTDDFSYPERIKKQVEFIKNNPQYSVVGMRCNYFDGQKVYGCSKFYGPVKKSNVINGVPFCHPTVIMKKKDIITVGGYPDFNRCEDYALWIRLYLNNYSGYVMEDIGLQYSLSLDDYKKRSLKTRRGFFKLLKSDYMKLKPGYFKVAKMYFKTFLAGIIPHKIMFKFQKSKMEKV